MSDDEIEIIKEVPAKKQNRVMPPATQRRTPTTIKHQSSSPSGFTISNAHQISQQEFAQQPDSARTTIVARQNGSSITQRNRTPNYEHIYHSQQPIRMPKPALSNPSGATGTAIIRETPLSLPQVRSTNAGARGILSFPSQQQKTVITPAGSQKRYTLVGQPQRSVVQIAQRSTNPVQAQVYARSRVQSYNPPRRNQYSSSIDRTVSQNVEAIRTNAAAKYGVSPYFESSGRAVYLQAKRPDPDAIRPAWKFEVPRVDTNRCYVRTKLWAVGEHEDEEFRGHFKCTWEDCDAVLPTNISFCNHVMAHFLTTPVRIDKDEENDNSDVSLPDFCRCGHCFLVFSNPRRLQLHTLHYHLNTPQAELANICCFICKREVAKPADLVLHMTTRHKGPDAPYFCKTCKFKSSLLDDLHFHFAKDHNNTRLLMCPLCLYVCEASMRESGRRGVATSKEFVTHIMDHIERQGEPLKCQSCQLVFARQADFERHKRHGHKKIDARDRLGQIQLIDGRPQTLAVVEGRRLPDRRLLRPAFKQLTLPEASCIECRQPMDLANHYRGSSTSCMVCPFKTTCNKSYENHMYDHAKGLEAMPSIFRRRETRQPQLWHCKCGYSSMVGNILASHLAECEQSDAVAYKGPPPVPKVVEVQPTTDEPLPDTVPIMEHLEIEVPEDPAPPRLLKHLRLHSKLVSVSSEYVDSDREDEDMINSKMREILDRRQRETERPQLNRALSSPRRQLRPRKGEGQPPSAKKPRLDIQHSGTPSPGRGTPEDERQHLSKRAKKAFVARHCNAKDIGLNYQAKREKYSDILDDLQEMQSKLSDNFDHRKICNFDDLQSISCEMVVDDLVESMVDKVCDQIEAEQEVEVVDEAMVLGEDDSIDLEAPLQIASAEVEEAAVDFEAFLAEMDDEAPELAETFEEPAGKLEKPTESQEEPAENPETSEEPAENVEMAPEGSENLENTVDEEMEETEALFSRIEAVLAS